MLAPGIRTDDDSSVATHGALPMNARTRAGKDVGMMLQVIPPTRRADFVWKIILTPFLALVVSLAGCGVDWGYVLGAAGGQINILWQSVPLSQATDSAALTPAQRAKLELIRDARLYAAETVGLNVAANFTLFYDSGGAPVLFNVSACRKDAFELSQWTFPIVGTVPYLGYFDRRAADAKFNELAAKQLDVFMYEVDAYSGLGYFPSVVLSPMLERSEISLTDTVFHELLHSTIWRPNDVTFNESLATFVGRTAAVEFLAYRYPDQPGLAQLAVEQFEDADRFNGFILTLFDDLDGFYASDLTSEEKIAAREAMYQAGRDRFFAEIQPLMNHPDRYAWVQQLPTNNAWLLGIRRYNLDLDVFQDAFQATGEDWTASLQLFRAAAAEPDPTAYLRTPRTEKSIRTSFQAAHPTSCAETVRKNILTPFLR